MLKYLQEKRKVMVPLGLLISLVILLSGPYISLAALQNNTQNTPFLNTTPPDSSLNEPLDTNYELEKGVRKFVPLVPINELYSQEKEPTLVEYINRLFLLVISLAAMLAVLRIVWGGFEYMTKTNSQKTVADARRTIQFAIFGLILLIGIVIILRTVNPQIVNLEVLKFQELAPDQKTLDSIRDTREKARLDAARNSEKVQSFAKQAPYQRTNLGVEEKYNQLDVTNDPYLLYAAKEACKKAERAFERSFVNTCKRPDGSLYRKDSGNVGLIFQDIALLCNAGDEFISRSVVVRCYE